MFTLERYQSCVQGQHFKITTGAMRLKFRITVETKKFLESMKKSEQLCLISGAIIYELTNEFRLTKAIKNIIGRKIQNS